MFKEPITDMGKKSKKGRLTLEYDNGQWSTTQEGTGDPDKVCVWLCFLMNGFGIIGLKMCTTVLYVYLL